MLGLHGIITFWEKDPEATLPNFKYGDSEIKKADRVNRVVFSLHQIKCRAFFFGKPVVNKYSAVLSVGLS